MVQEHWRWREAMRERIGHVDSLMQGGPVLCGESYPDECWIFCNTAALAALRMSDALDSTDHTSFFVQWRAMAQQALTDPETGLLVSSFSHDGRTFDGPEGSSIWVAATFLQLVDPSWAKDQYNRAKQHLAERFLGFGYGREWPRSWEGHADIDSGPIVPFVEAAAGSSGAAIVGARAFGDGSFLEALIDSLDLAAFPSWEGDSLHYAASNGVGDALMLFGLSFGPLWKAVQRRMA